MEPATLQARAATLFASLTLRLVMLAVIVLLVLNTYADFAIKGPLGIGFHFEGWKPKAQRYKRTVDEIAAAQKQAQKAAQEAKERAERSYRELAERIDNDADDARAGALDGAERFIAANRVRCTANRGSSGGPVAAASNRGAGDGQAVPSAPELDGAVAVPASDIRVCTVNTLQAEAAREWALGLEAASDR